MLGVWQKTLKIMEKTANFMFDFLEKSDYNKECTELDLHK